MPVKRGGPGDLRVRRSDPAKETQRLIAKLEALGHKVTLEPPPDHRIRLRRVLPRAQLEPVSYQEALP